MVLQDDVGQRPGGLRSAHQLVAQRGVSLDQLILLFGELLPLGKHLLRHGGEAHVVKRGRHVEAGYAVGGVAQLMGDRGTEPRHTAGMLGGVRIDGAGHGADYVQGAADHLLALLAQAEPLAEVVADAEDDATAVPRAPADARLRRHERAVAGL